MAPTLDNNLQTQLLEPGNQLQKPLKVHFNDATMEPELPSSAQVSPPDSPIEDLRTDSPSEIKQASSESEMSSTDMPQESEGERPSKKPCTVCGEPTRGVYYGAVACLPCKTFFVRYSGEKTPMKCRTGKRTCDINEATRVSCKACRYAKCIRVGMKRKGKHFFFFNFQLPKPSHTYRCALAFAPLYTHVFLMKSTVLCRDG